MIMFAATMVYGGGHYHPEARRLSAQRDTAIQMDGFRSLAEGDKVEFEVAKGPKGLQAQNVRKQ